MSTHVRSFIYRMVKHCKIQVKFNFWDHQQSFDWVKTFLSPRFFKKASGILQLPPSVRPSVHPSVRPSRYLLLNHWTKSNQIWCVGYSHEWVSVRLSVRPSVTLSPPKPLDEIQPNLVCGLLTWMGCATAHFFWPRPLGPWGGAKRSNIITYN